MYVVHDHYQLVAVDNSYRRNGKQNCLSDWVRNCSLRSDSDNLEKTGAAVKLLVPFVAIYRVSQEECAILREGVT